ncbi:hypothetical protein NEFER03_2015 [Nematocida sp. LUAm3]|nr:hypothetical protein NEFER03_2015 [Nematocida sp. LUAm3]KAI5174489.1 hypothetical protein NEFER02_0610 [Nematocida sp. LUAm2]KAI5179140.1 hypothetical protein NEFER01_2003 [Nematocida sp. LUAm1]
MGGCSGECVCRDMVSSKSLYSVIDMENVSGLNEEKRGGVREIIQKSWADREAKSSARCKGQEGLIVRVPFLRKVSLNKIEIKSTFKEVRLFINNRYASFTTKCKNEEKYFLPGTEHIIPLVLPSYKYKSVDYLTLHLLCSEEEKGALFYLCLCGEEQEGIRKAVNVSYELYPLPENTKASEKSKSNQILH